MYCFLNILPMAMTLIRINKIILKDSKKFFTLVLFKTIFIFGSICSIIDFSNTFVVFKTPILVVFTRNVHRDNLLFDFCINSIGKEF